MKTKVSLSILMSLMVFYVQPAWSMEETEEIGSYISAQSLNKADMDQAMQDVSFAIPMDGDENNHLGKKRKQQEMTKDPTPEILEPLIKRRNDNEGEENGENSQAIVFPNLMDLPDEVIIKILFYTYKLPSFKKPLTFLNAQLVNHKWQTLVNDPQLINELLEHFVWGYFLEKQDLEPDARYKRDFALFRVFNESLTFSMGSSKYHQVFLDALEKGPVSESRMLVYTLIDHAFRYPNFPDGVSTLIPFPYCISLGNSPVASQKNCWLIMAERIVPALLSFQEDIENNRFSCYQEMAIRKIFLAFEVLKEEKRNFAAAISNLLRKKPEVEVPLQIISAETLALKKRIVEEPEQEAKKTSPALLKYVASYDRSLSLLTKVNILKAVAELGDVEEQHRVATAYEGHGLVYANSWEYDQIVDLNEALKWHERAAEGGHQSSILRLSSSYQKGTEGVSKDLSKAIHWYTEALKNAPLQHGYITYNLAKCYKERKSCSEDLEQAFINFQKAANEGDIRAQYQVGLCYEKGEGVHKDPEQALNLFREAAQGDEKHAQYKLSLLYEKGEGVPQDAEKSLEFLKAAAKNWHRKAKYKLGLRYLTGDLHVQQDTKRAVEYFDSASKHGHKIANTFVKGLVKMNGHFLDDSENSDDSEDSAEEVVEREEEGN